MNAQTWQYKAVKLTYPAGDELPYTGTANVHNFNELADTLRSFLETSAPLPSTDEKRSLPMFVEFGQSVALIDSMTPQERLYPQLLSLDPSRARRIADGTGVGIDAVIRLIRHFDGSAIGQKRAIPIASRVAPIICEQFHQSVIAGTCPWCGVRVGH